MHLFMYSIYDSASCAYMRPFYAQTDGMATRSFGDIAQDANHEIGKHPADYTLFKVGIFDDNTGEIVPMAPERIASALELVSQARNIAPGQLSVFDQKLKVKDGNLDG